MSVKLINHVLGFLFLVFLTVFFSSDIYASHRVFNDDFSTTPNGSFPSGWILVNDPGSTPCSANWTVNNGKVGISINQGSCVTNIMPGDALWNNLGNNYVFEVDMEFVSGTDHNVAFRFEPGNLPQGNSWYDLHFQSPNDFLLERVTGSYSINIPGNYSNGNTYNLKIIVNDKNIKVYVNNVLVRDFTSTIDNYPTGRIALRATTGGDPISETYFDNIKVTSIDDNDILNVPYFSQNASPWGSQEYDHAVSLGFSNTKFERWGCAVTSAAMILNYHGITKFADDTPITPGSLNEWLKNNKGYLTGSNQAGSYSSIVWQKISELTGQLYAIGKAPIKLIHRRASPNDQLLDEDLMSSNFPDILKVSNSQTTMHFVVATGKDNNVYTVNDPEWNYTSLSSFNDSYQQIDRYVPTHTNFSYLQFVINPDTELLITDPQGRRSGVIIENGSVTNYDEIPGAHYSFQEAISNPEDGGELESFGTGVNEFLLPEPIDGNYKITISSFEEIDYQLNVATFEEDAKNQIHVLTGDSMPGVLRSVSLDYSQTQPSEIFEDKIVTINVMIKDIQKLQKENKINKLFATRLILLLRLAQTKILSRHKEEIFDRIADLLEKERGDKLTEEAYQVLKHDIDFLLDNTAPTPSPPPPSS